ncbi:GntR family transcriptional regulator [Ornithinibacillus halotolerans]|uniref:GntR family transcriptional regulator n=2 Tax=Ornithinibacillus halotolerans TaxID=1274357 RepID=A0A916S3R3_9BACI|nr:GntR family transcriptional regulator [Ornithinibacillus halotolerans]
MSMSPKQKVYQGILEEVRNLIETNDLKPGDKLPSERELSEKLNAGRSSVREALRAMELIGVIETRRGEGTFLSKYRPYQTVELLSTFIFKETTKEELLSVKTLLEKEAAKLASTKMDESNLGLLLKKIDDPSLTMEELHFAFFSIIFEKTENQFLMRIWALIDEYTKSFTRYYSKPFYSKLITVYQSNDEQQIDSLFKEENDHNY